MTAEHEHCLWPPKKSEGEYQYDIRLDLALFYFFIFLKILLLIFLPLDNFLPSEFFYLF